MSRYSIAELEQLSGVKAHTIRIWEKRYNMWSPDRTDTNIRSYNDEQLRHLLNVSLLVSRGIRISKISKMSEDELRQKIQTEIEKSSDGEVRTNFYINDLLMSGLRYDEAAFLKMFRQAIREFGIVETYKKVIYPLLVKIGLMWQKEDLYPAQEHFISSLIYQQLYVAIDELPLPRKKEKWLLFLPDEESHEIGLLLSNFLVREAGFPVFHMGPRLPYQDLRRIVREISPQYLMFFIIRKHTPKELQKFFDKLEEDFPGLKKCVAGNFDMLSKVKMSDDTILIRDLEEFVKLIDQDS